MKLREIRRAKNITQKQLGEAIGVNNSIISKYEKGLVIPPADKLAKLADYLQVSMDELLNDDVQRGNRAAQDSSRFIQNDYGDDYYQREMLGTEEREEIEAMYASALRRSKGRCELCGQEALFSLPDGSPYLLAHIVPLRSNGEIKPSNVLAVCQNCNLKQASTQIKFRGGENIQTRRKITKD